MIEKRNPKAIGANRDLPIKAFASAQAWAQWLGHNLSSKGIWLRFFKKSSEVSTVTYAEALDEALCHGWIDGQLKKYDEKSWLQRFTPRRQRSVWSKRNVANVTRLMESGRMTAAGLKEVEAARNDGRWASAYDSPRAMKAPPDFLAELSKDRKANAFFKTLDRANLYAIAWRLQTARTAETRERRKNAIIEMLRKGEKFH